METSPRLGEQGGAARAGAAPQAMAGDEWPILLIALAYFYAAFAPLFRDLGAAALLPVAAGLALVSVLRARKQFQPGLIVFAAIGIIWTILSAADWLHAGVTRFYEPGAIMRQMFYTVFLAFSVPALQLYHARVSAGMRAWLNLELFILVCAVAAKIWLAFIASPAAGVSALGISQFINADALAAFIVMRRWLVGGRFTRLVAFCAALIFLVTAGSLQSSLILLAAIVLIALPQFRTQIVLGGIALVIVVPIIAEPFATQIVLWDPNTGIRLFFWQDALERVWKSGLLGVGFGTETVQPSYEIAGREVTISGLDRSGYIHVGAHNAIVDATYRMGIAGGGVLLLYLASQFRRVLAVPRRPSLLDCWVACALCVTLMVNVSLASINFLFGTTFYIAWLAYRGSLLPADPGRRVRSGEGQAPR